MDLVTKLGAFEANLVGGGSSSPEDMDTERPTEALPEQEQEDNQGGGSEALNLNKVKDYMGAPG